MNIKGKYGMNGYVSELNGAEALAFQYLHCATSLPLYGHMRFSGSRGKIKDLKTFGLGVGTIERSIHVAYTITEAARRGRSISERKLCFPASCDAWKID